LGGQASFDVDPVALGGGLASSWDSGGKGTERKQVKMLNGRVYGRRLEDDVKRSKDVQEPAFVEWGGLMGDRARGMGSNQSASASAAASGGQQQQQRRSIRTEGDEGAAAAASMGGNSRSVAEDEDDGSGLAWVKKRREARERARRESEVVAMNKVQEEDESAASHFISPLPHPQHPSESSVGPHDEVQDRGRDDVPPLSPHRRRDESPHGTTVVTPPTAAESTPLPSIPSISVAPPSTSTPSHEVQAFIIPRAKAAGVGEQDTDVPILAARYDEDEEDTSEEDDEEDAGGEYSEDDEEDILEEESKRWVCGSRTPTGLLASLTTSSV
jgi:hypothetical protein